MHSVCYFWLYVDIAVGDPAIVQYSNCIVLCVNLRQGIEG